MINESILKEMACNEEAVFTGEQIADLVGLGDLYRQGKAEIAQEEQMTENVKNNFANLVERMQKVPSNTNKIID